MNPGDRVVWSASFLDSGRRIDPRWYLEHLSQVGTIERVQRDGDVIVQWDDSDCTTVHPPNRLARYL